MIAVWLFLISSLFAVQPVWGHKTRVFAYGDGEYISGEAAFSGGKMAKDIEILVIDSASGTELSTGRTDNTGQFSIAIPEKAIVEKLDLLVVANGGDGHRAEWLLEAEAYLPGDSASSTPKLTEPALVQSPAVNIPTQKIAEPECLTQKQFEQQLDQSLKQQLQPIKHMLTKSQEPDMSFREVLGSIGYLIGVAGIIAYLKSRKGESNE